MECVLKYHGVELTLGYVESGVFLEEGEETDVVECGFYLGGNVALIADSNMYLRMKTYDPDGYDLLGRATIICRDNDGEYVVVSLEGDFHHCDLCGEHGSAFAILEDGRRVFVGNPKIGGLMVPAVFISSSLLYAEDKDAILKEYDVVLVLRAKEGVSLRMMAEMLKAWFGNEVVVITPELEVSLYFLSAGFKLRGVEDGVLGRLYSGIPTNLQDEEDW